MNSWWPRKYCSRPVSLLGLFLLLGGLSIADCFAQEETDSESVVTNVSDKSIEELIDQLEAKTSRERQQAMRALLAEGEAAIAAIEIRLLQSTTSDSLSKEEKQVADRRRMLQLGGLIRMAGNNDIPLRSDAEKALLRISKQGDVPLRRLAAKALSKVNETSEDNTIELLRSKNVEVQMFRSKFAKSLPQEYDIKIGSQYNGTLEDLDWLATLTEDSDVTFIGERYTDAFMEKIAVIPSLRGVTLRETSVTNAGLRLLRESETLRRLTIRKSEIDGSVIREIAALPRMRRLTMIETEVPQEVALELQEKYPKLTVAWASGAFLGVNFKIDEAQCELTNVLEDSGAAKAGMKIGDKLVMFNDQVIAGSADFQKVIAEFEPGDTVNAAVLRNGRRIEMTVTLGRYPY